MDSAKPKSFLVHNYLEQYNQPIDKKESNPLLHTYTLSGVTFANDKAEFTTK